MRSDVYLLYVFVTSEPHQDWDAGGSRWSDLKHMEQAKVYWTWKIGQ